MKEKNRLENGQAIVLLVISLVVLLGFTALAIDGGMVYSDRRQAQNAADTASLAGAGQVAARLEAAKITSLNWNCTAVFNAVDTDAIDAAIYRSKTNGYVVQEGNMDENGDIVDENGIILDDNYVFVDCNQTGKYVDVKTAILAETQTSFAHLFVQGQLQNRVNATTRVNASESFGGMNALLALNTNKCQGNNNGLIFSGDAEVTLLAGDAYTNCCLLGNGSKFVVTTTEGGGVYYYEDDAGVCGPDGKMNNVAQPEGPQEGNKIYTPFDPIWIPQCGGDPGSPTLDGDTLVYRPGTYTTKIKQSDSKAKMRMEPGLYCLTSKTDAFSVTGGDLYAEGVTLYVTQDGVTITGGGSLVMSAPCTNADGQKSRCDDEDDPENYPDPALEYFLIYMAENNNNPIRINGTSISYFEGIIYSANGDVVLAGTSSVDKDLPDTTTFHTQVIAKNIEVTGTGEVNIVYDGSFGWFEGSKLDNLE